MLLPKWECHVLVISWLTHMFTILNNYDMYNLYISSVRNTYIHTYIHVHVLYYVHCTCIYIHVVTTCVYSYHFLGHLYVVYIHVCISYISIDACLAACLSAYLPACLPVFLLNSLHAFISDCLSACLSACLPSAILTHK